MTAAEVIGNGISISLGRNPTRVTVLNPVISYQAAALNTKRAYPGQRPVLEVVKEEIDLSRAELEGLPAPSTHGYLIAILLPNTCHCTA